MKIKKELFEKIIREELNAYLQLEQDEAAAEELKLYIDNEATFHNQFQSIRKNLMNKKASGIYDPMQAVKLFMYLVDAGAKQYAKEFGGGGATGPSVGGFDKPTRLEVAKAMLQDFESESALGNFDDMLHKKYQKQTQELDEVSPPGCEKQVKALKKELPKTYADKETGKSKESNPWAVAWKSYKKSKEKK